MGDIFLRLLRVWVSGECIDRHAQKKELYKI